MQVSPLCLGAMMFGAWGEPDHDDSIRIIHRALDAGHQLHRHRRRLLAGRVGGDRRQGAGRRPARRRDPGHQVPRPDGRPMGEPGGDPNQRGNSRRWIMQRGREQPAPAADRLDRPLPGAPARRRTPTSRRRSAALTDLQRAGQDPRLRLARPSRPTRSSRRSGSPSGAASAASSPSSRRTRCWCAASRPTCCRSPSSTAWACCRGARWPAAG